MRKLLSVGWAIWFLLLMAGAAQAQWCGENGVIKLSFTEAPSLQSVATVPAGDKGVTIVDLYAYLTGVEPLQKDGEAFVAIAGLEMTLLIEGAEGFITAQDFPMKNRSVGRRPGEVIAGMYPGISLDQKQTQLVHWQILFQGHPQNVVFRLDPDGGVTSKRTPGVREAHPYALYTGTEASKQVGSIFSAGYVPAYLNYSGKPDLTPLRGKVTWQEAGVYQKR